MLILEDDPGIRAAAFMKGCLRHLAYEEKKLTLKDFLNILEKDYDGDEALRGRRHGGGYAAPRR